MTNTIGSVGQPVHISSANHETATIEDAESVFEEMRGLFDRGLYFLGNLSDVAISNHLASSTFFAFTGLSTPGKSRTGRRLEKSP